MAKRIVVVGGGFAGLHLIRRLEGIVRPGEVELTLLDRNNYHLFTPLLYQVATGELPPHAVAYPLRLPIAHAHQRFVQTEVEGVDVERRAVHTADGDFAYDHLVLVPGSVTNDFGIAGVASHALPVKTLQDGLAVRKRILETVENAAREPDLERRKALLSFVIIGAGPVGVELATSIRDLMDHSLRRMYPELDLVRDPKITLIDAADRVLTAMDERLARIAMTQLARTAHHGRPEDARVGDRGGDRPDEGRHAVPRRNDRVGGRRTDASARERARGRDAREGQTRRGGPDVPCRRPRRSPVVRRCRALRISGQAAPAARAGRRAPGTRGGAQPRASRARESRSSRTCTTAKATSSPSGVLTPARSSLRYGNVVLGGLPAWTVWRANYLMQLVGVRNRATLLLEWLLSYFFTRMVADTP